MLSQSGRRDPGHICAPVGLLDSVVMTDGENKPKDPSAALLNAMDGLDVGALSYVQLGLLQKATQNTLDVLAKESARRAAEDDAGDTVVIPASQSV